MRVGVILAFFLIIFFFALPIGCPSAISSQPKHRKDKTNSITKAAKITLILMVRGLLCLSRYNEPSAACQG